MLYRLFLIAAILLVGPGAAFPAQAQISHILEFRRTAHSANCDTGELYVDGKIVTLFSAAPGLIDGRLQSDPFVGDTLISVSYVDPWPGLGGKRRGFSLTAEGKPGAIRVISLDGSSYSDYVRPRARKYAIPADAILLGTSVLPRECKISAYVDDDYYSFDPSIGKPTSLLSPAVFDGKLAFDPYPAGMQVRIIALVSDSSAAAGLSAGGLKLSRSGEIPSAETAGEGSPCLLPIEHGTNTRISTAGKTYVRLDDVWFCPLFTLQGGLGTAALEVARRPGYILFHSLTSCGSVLGLPIQRTYLFDRGADGTGGALWSRCYGNEDFAKIGDQSTIDFGSE